VDTIDEYNMVVDGIGLNNSWRKSTSRIVEMRPPAAAAKTAAIEFIIEADTEDELAERWAITKNEFNKAGVSAYGYRETDTAKLFDYSPREDGETRMAYSSVSMIAQEEQTALSIYAILEISATVTDSPSGSSGGAMAGAKDAPRGSLDGIEFVTVHEAGERVTLTAAGSFGGQLGEESLGPLSIISVTENSTTGFCVFHFTETVSPPSDDEKMYCTISGTTKYNGQYAVKNVEENSVEVVLAFAGAETTGTISIGDVETAEELLTLGEDEIFDAMGIGQNNVTLVGRMVKTNGDGTVDFMFSAQEQDFVPGGIGDGRNQLVKSVTMSVVEDAPLETWEQDADLEQFGGGTAPTPITIEGSVAINVNASSGSLRADWLGIQSAIVGRAVAIAGSGDLQILKIEARYGTGTPSIGFTITALAEFGGAISLEKVEQSETNYEAFVYTKGPNLHGVQFPQVEPVVVYTRSITRAGVGEVDLSLYPPMVQAGYYMHLRKVVDGPNRGPVASADLGNNVYLQMRTETWLRLKLA
jgi:hypothetical protein